VGTKVLWINMDDAPHTVTHGAPPSSFGGEFRSNSLSRGDGFSHTFNTPGTFNYFCEIHPSLRGRIVVTSGAAPTATPVPAAPTPVPPPTPTSTPAPATPAPTEAKVSSSIYDFRLTNLTVKVGTTVTWTNADPEQHTVTHGTSPNAEGLFSSPVLKQSDSYSYTFTQAGAFPYFCAIHTDMTATVNVTP
jgi:plastocyanin